MPAPAVLALAIILAAAAGCGGSREPAGAGPAVQAPAPIPVRLLVRATFDEPAQPEVSRPVFSDDGLDGRALSGTSLWQLPALGHFALREGTVEFRLRLDLPAPQTPGWNLLRIRPPGPPGDSYLNGFNVIHGWGQGLFLLVGDREVRLKPLAFPGTSEWKSGAWHHLAFTWRVAAPGQCSLALYVDETLVERRDGLTLDFDAAAWEAAAASGPAQLLILAGTVWGQSAGGAIDDLRLYDRARRYEVQP